MTHSSSLSLYPVLLSETGKPSTHPDRMSNHNGSLESESTKFRHSWFYGITLNNNELTIELSSVVMLPPVAYHIRVCENISWLHFHHVKREARRLREGLVQPGREE